MTNYVYNPGYLEIEESIIDSDDNSKRANFNLSSIPTNTTIDLNLPPESTTLVGTDIEQTLTNKTIIDNTNNVSANSLKTTGIPVRIDTATPPSANQLLTAISPTNAVWQTTMQTWLWKEGTMITPTLSSLKQWHGYVSTSGKTATFYVTANGLPGGPAVFTDLSNSHFQVSARNDTTTIIDIPFASIRSVNNTTNVVLVNVLLPTGILIGGVSMRANNSAARVYLSIIGN